MRFGTGPAVLLPALLLAILVTGFSLKNPLDSPEDVQAARRGSFAFRAMCQSCHGIDVLGIKPATGKKRLREKFGVVPPDLSWITRARGKGVRGEKYVYDLLTGYVATKEKNKVLPNLAMPDPGVNAEMAADIAVFLRRTADPNAGQRRLLGYIVISYTLILAAVVYLAKRAIWRDLK